MVTLAAALCLLLSVPATAQSGAAGSLLAANSPRAAEARLDSPNPPAEGEIRALEAQVQIVLTEARRQQELLAEQRQRLAVAEAANAWLPWLLLAVVGLADSLSNQNSVLSG